VKLLVGASAGGHANDLDTLLAHASWPVAAYVTTSRTRLAALQRTGARVHLIAEADRNTPLAAVRALFGALRVVLRERPTAVVTTGGFPMLFVCVFARALRARVVWVDCVSQTEVLSGSGRWARKVAHLTLTQWPAVAAATEGVEYAGEVM
jgi:UDP-N-acetylglucosamine:LPS N-acetylglucosamine transferase